MSEIVRYSLRGASQDLIKPDINGEYVRFDYADLRIKMLENCIRSLVSESKWMREEYSDMDGAVQLAEALGVS